VLSAVACPPLLTDRDLTNILRDLARGHESDFIRRARFCDGPECHHEMIQAGPGYELWLLSWLPGQITPIHDHGGAVTVTTVLAGAVLEERFELTRGLEVRPTWTTVREVGDLDAIDPLVIHRVRPIGSAVTLHLYAPTCVDGQTYQLPLS
jgi:predicted metal-dependent enzyme (double-stranded beta helix superfamily)